jgi:hypothetical protein
VCNIKVYQKISDDVHLWNKSKDRSKRMYLGNDMTQERQRGVPAGKNESRRTNFQLEGFWPYLARGVWITFVLAELVLSILSLFVSRTYGLTICPFSGSCAITPASAQALHQLGIAPSTYMTYNLVLASLQSLVFLSVGGLIFWRRSSEPLCLATSFVFVVLGLSPINNGSSYPPAVFFGYLYALCVFPALGFFLLTFPDGRFVPRWSWILAVLWVVQVILFEFPGSYNILFWPPPLFIAELLLTYGGTLGVLMYRYVRVFSFSQRQQAKWLVFGLAVCALLIILYALIGSLVPGLADPSAPYQLVSGTLTTVTFLIIPLSVGVAILRYRLWDIDNIINRTLVYGSLTAMLALVYFGLVIGLQSLVRLVTGTISEQPIIIVASTLAIAALFQPLRRRIQRTIDRRFYRRKYDAARTLAVFSAILRDEVDLDQLKEELVAVVQETMQPTHVSLWLLQPGKEEKRESE